MVKEPKTKGVTQKELEFGNPRIVESDDGCTMFVVGFIVGVLTAVISFFFLVI